MVLLYGHGKLIQQGVGGSDYLYILFGVHLPFYYTRVYHILLCIFAFNLVYVISSLISWFLGSRDI